MAGTSAQSPAYGKIDPWTKVFYVPRTVTFLVLGLLAIVYFSRAFNPPDDPRGSTEAHHVAQANVGHGIWAVILAYLGYSVIQGPTTSMVRPHPAVWRGIHGLAVVYLLFVIFLLFQNANDARLLLKHLYPELGVEPQERAYGNDCRLVIPGKGVNWEVIKATVFDEFVIAHILGWWCKTLILRNTVLLWILSIAFELMELTFQHMLPNFNECWWDSWVLDVLVCNFLGIWTGMKTVRYFGSKEYNWTGVSEQPNIIAAAKRSLLQFTPYSWDNLDWKVFSSPLRCLQCLGPLAVILVFEVNAFFLKYVLWIPPRNPLNTFRLAIMFLVACPACREYYVFIEGNQRDIFNKLGVFAWLGVAIAIAETLVSIKFGRGMFPAPWPAHVLWFWGVVGAAFAVVMAVWSIRFYGLGGRRRQAGAKKIA